MYTRSYLEAIKSRLSTYCYGVGVFFLEVRGNWKTQRRPIHIHMKLKTDSNVSSRLTQGLWSYSLCNHVCVVMGLNSHGDVLAYVACVILL